MLTNSDLLKPPENPIKINALSLILSSCIALIIVAPVFAIFYSAFLGDTSLWPHLFSTVLPRYISNTIILMVGVGILSSILGVSTAWAVTRYDFFGKILVLGFEIENYKLEN